MDVEPQERDTNCFDEWILWEREREILILYPYCPLQTSSRGDGNGIN